MDRKQAEETAEETTAVSEAEEKAAANKRFKRSVQRERRDRCRGSGGIGRGKSITRNDKNISSARRIIVGDACFLICPRGREKQMDR